MENISKHITYAEATKSFTAVKYNKENRPDAQQLVAMKHVAATAFEPLREHFKKPIAVTSFFRSNPVNVLIGGKANSQHCKGEAMDLDADVLGGLTNADMFFFIKNHLDFDQLIWEFGNGCQPAWIHVSGKKQGNRKQVLRSLQNNFKTEYVKWIG